jgi:hypothetical protein
MKEKIAEKYTRLLRKMDKFIQAMAGHCGGGGGGTGHCS